MQLNTHLKCMYMACFMFQKLSNFDTLLIEILRTHYLLDRSSMDWAGGGEAVQVKVLLNPGPYIRYI